jgi:FAD/FMN-containing dehydrogenase
MPELASKIIRPVAGPAPDFLESLRAIVGERYVLTQESDTAPYLVEERGLYRGTTRAVVRPGTAEEVARVLALCNQESVPVVPQGGNTGLVGGQTPSADGVEVVLSLRRLDRIREIDAAANTMIVEAGVTLLGVQEAAEKAGRLFPLSLASEGSCTIGGNLATNAGGTAVIAYGNTRDLVLGIEVALPDGRLLSSLGKLKKDNTGYDLKHLFMGSEGTLGIITAAVLKLFPRPRSTATAFIGLPTAQAALDLLGLAQERAGSDVKTFELIPRIGIDFVLRHAANVRDPLAAPHAWYVLLEMTSQTNGGLEATIEELLGEAAERGILDDAVLANSLDQRNAFWRLREMLSEVQKFEGGSIKHDISVPVSSVPAFLDEVAVALAAAMPGARLVAFGHLGDGNIHCNVSQPTGADKQRFLAQWSEVNAIVHGIVGKHHGSISAEHGIGVMKRDLLPQWKDPVALAVMRSIKSTLDPNNILNPGKVL